MTPTESATRKPQHEREEKNQSAKQSERESPELMQNMSQVGLEQILLGLEAVDFEFDASEEQVDDGDGPHEITVSHVIRLGEDWVARVDSTFSFPKGSHPVLRDTIASLFSYRLRGRAKTGTSGGSEQG